MLFVFGFCFIFFSSKFSSEPVKPASKIFFLFILFIFCKISTEKLYSSIVLCLNIWVTKCWRSANIVSLVLTNQKGVCLCMCGFFSRNFCFVYLFFILFFSNFELKRLGGKINRIIRYDCFNSKYFCHICYLNAKGLNRNPFEKTLIVFLAIPFYTFKMFKI